MEYARWTEKFASIFRNLLLIAGNLEAEIKANSKTTQKILLTHYNNYLLVHNVTLAIIPSLPTRL
jgi:hypothetical protein